MMQAERRTYLTETFSFSESDHKKLPYCRSLSKEEVEKINKMLPHIYNDITGFSVNLNPFLAKKLNINNSITAVRVIDLMWFRAGLGQSAVASFLIHYKINIIKPNHYKTLQLSELGFFIFGLLTGLLPPSTTDNFHTPRNLTGIHMLMYECPDIDLNFPALILKNESLSALEIINLLGKDTKDPNILNTLKIIRNWLIAYGAIPPKNNSMPLFDEADSPLAHLKSLPHIPARYFLTSYDMYSNFYGFIPLTTITGDVCSALRFRMNFWRRFELFNPENLDTAEECYSDITKESKVALNCQELLSQFWQPYLAAILSGFRSSIINIIADYHADPMYMKIILSGKIIPVDGYGYFDLLKFKYFNDEKLVLYHKISRVLCESAAFNKYDGHLDNEFVYRYSLSGQSDILKLLKFDSMIQNSAYRKGLVLKLWYLHISEALNNYRETFKEQQFTQFKKILYEIPKYIDDSKTEVSILDDDKESAPSSVNLYTKELKEIIPHIQKKMIIFAETYKKTKPDIPQEYPNLSSFI